MAHKTRNPGAGRRQGFAVEMVSEAGLAREYSPLSVLRQEEIDVVGLLAARSRVAPATIRAQFDAWKIGGANA